MATEMLSQNRPTGSPGTGGGMTRIANFSAGQGPVSNLVNPPTNQGGASTVSVADREGGPTEPVGLLNVNRAFNTQPISTAREPRLVQSMNISGPVSRASDIPRPRIDTRVDPHRSFHQTINAEFGPRMATRRFNRRFK